MLTGDNLLDFGLLTRLVDALLYIRASDKKWPLVDAGLVRVILEHSRTLYILGGRRTLDRAALHLSRQVGPSAAAVALSIWRSDHLLGIYYVL